MYNGFTSDVRMTYDITTFVAVFQISIEPCLRFERFPPSAGNDPFPLGQQDIAQPSELEGL